jgi:predicted RND superfamily exporter protein
MGKTLSMMSVFGVVALSGVVVNSSLVLVYYVNGRRAGGASVVEAVRDAGEARFRPIVLTSLTTFAGLTPLLLERSVSAQFLIPMAISLAFGVVFATLIALFLVPSLYFVLDDLKRYTLRNRALAAPEQEVVGVADHEPSAKRGDRNAASLPSSLTSTSRTPKTRAEGGRR